MAHRSRQPLPAPLPRLAEAESIGAAIAAVPAVRKVRSPKNWPKHCSSVLESWYKAVEADLSRLFLFEAKSALEI
jgi:hypothetical protein